MKSSRPIGLWSIRSSGTILKGHWLSNIVSHVILSAHWARCLLISCGRHSQYEDEWDWWCNSFCWRRMSGDATLDCGIFMCVYFVLLNKTENACKLETILKEMKSKRLLQCIELTRWYLWTPCFAQFRDHLRHFTSSLVFLRPSNTSLDDFDFYYLDHF